MQNGQKFLSSNLVVVIQIVHFECKSQFLVAVIQFVLPAFLDGPEPGQNTHELPKVDPIISIGLAEKSLDNPISQRVNRQLRDPQEVFSTQCPIVPLVEAREPAVEPLDLTRRNCKTYNA